MHLARFVPQALMAAVLLLGCGQRVASKPEPTVALPANPPIEAPSDSADTPESTEEPGTPTEEPPVPTAGEEPPAPTPGEEPPAPTPGEAPTPELDCSTVRAGIEAALSRAELCETHQQCTMVHFHVAFGPCGVAARKDAQVESLQQDAVRYVERCAPPLTRVRCAHFTGALCKKGRCELASPSELEAAGVPSSP